MSTNKHIDRICIAAIIISMIISLLFAGGAFSGIIPASETVFKYEETLFDTSKVHQIDIEMDNWDEFIESCENEEYVNCNITIDGEKYKNIAIRAKGNTSLSSVSTMGSQRYSFKIEFDHNDPNITYNGLDKLALNNVIQDNTYMKDYIVYNMMRESGVASPLCSFSFITVNGEDWGLYLSVEAVEDSFLKRNYGNDSGDLYKPDSMSFGGGRGNGKGFDMGDFDFSQFKKDDTSGSDNDQAVTDSENTASDKNEPAVTSAENNSSDTKAADSGSSNDSSAPSNGMKMPEGFDPSSMGGNAPEGMDFSNFDPSSMGGGAGFDPSSMGGNAPEGMDFSNFDPSSMGGGNGGMTPPDGMQMPEGFDPSSFGSKTNGDDAENSNSTVTTIVTTTETAQTSEENTASDSGNGSGAMTPPDGMQKPDNFDPSNFGGGNMPGGFGGMGSSDVKLAYSDDDPDSYSNIFDSAKTPVTDADKKRLIASLKSLSEYTDLEEVLDTESVLRYMAAHIFINNGDSYTGSMIHNYYLHEQDGQLEMIPWDYNLAYGTFMGGNASSAVNDAIDDVLDDRPMQAWIFSSEEYTELYHQYMAELISNNNWDEIVDTTAALIAPYVEKDPTAFCTYEEFETGVEAIKTFLNLRSESVLGQIDGTIPSTSTEQTDSSTLVDASELNLSDMGTMNNGGGGFGGGDKGGMTPPDGMEMPEGFDPSSFDGNMPEGFDPSNFGGNMPEGFDPSNSGGNSQEDSSGNSNSNGMTPPNGMQIPEGFDPSNFGGGKGNPFSNSDASADTASSTDNSAETEISESNGSSGDSADQDASQDAGNDRGNRGGKMQPGEMPDGMNPGGSSPQTIPASAYILLGISAVLLAGGIIFAAKYRR